MLNVVPHIGLNESFNDALRTEDIRFSPSGRILAVVATSGNIYVFAVDTDARPIRIIKHAVLHAQSLASPHGIDFISEDVVVVANRTGWLTFYRLPGENVWKESMPAEHIHEMESPWFGSKGATRKSGDRSVSCGPGSVRVHGDYVYVCCNNQHTVTAHPFRLKRGSIETKAGDLLVQDGLEIPDGLSLSRDGRWLAVGEHHYRCITIYRCTTMSPVCELRDDDLCHPHGICFDPSGRVLYVADAGDRGMHVFISKDDWATSMNSSSFTLAAVEDGAFQKTKESVPEMFRSLEGGIKGIDVDTSGRLIATTCQNQMLRFFESDLGPVAIPPVGWRERWADGARRLLGRAQGMSDDANVAWSCVVDDTPAIWFSVVPWLATAIELAHIPPAFLHVHHVCPLNNEITQLCQARGVNTHKIEPFDARYPHTNKIRQCATDFAGAGKVVLTDVDMVFASRPPVNEVSTPVAGKLVDLPNPPMEILQNIFAAAGVVLPRYVTPRHEHVKFPTLPGNFNGGFYVIDQTLLASLGVSWAHWARWLITNIDLMDRWSVHVDQVSLCLAVNEMKLDLGLLDDRWNYPLHLPHAAGSAEPYILHHHAAFDRQRHLKESPVPAINQAIGRVNATIDSFSHRP